MAPRGRPPGRKSSLLNRQQHQRKLKQKPVKKPGRPSRKSIANSSSSAAPEIRVASPEIAESETHARLPSLSLPLMEDLSVAAANAQNGLASHGSSAASDNDTLSDNQSVVASEGQPAPAAEAAAEADEASAVEVAAPASTGSVSPPPPGTNGNGQTARLNGGLSTSVPIRGTGQRNGHNNRSASHGLSYAAPTVDLDVLSYRQLNEDIDAYRIDLEFCQSQLAQPDLTPQEARTLQLRQLDLGHQIRFSQHRREMLEAERMAKGGRSLSGPSEELRRARSVAAVTLATKTPRQTKRAMSVTAPLEDPSTNKRTRSASEASGPETISVLSDNGAGPSMAGGAFDDELGTPGPSVHEGGGGGGTQSLQRLGYWKCRLCMSEKYLMAGAGRQPSAPSKWPLKDMGKLMSHYFDMHTEHEPDERCAELGDALDHNRGPFEYWLRKSRGQRMTDLSIIDQVVQELQAGRVPKTLRDLCRAAAAFQGA